MKYAGAEWLRGCKVEVSPFAARVADLVGYVWQGIYHIHNVERKDWSNPYSVTISIRGELATTDSNHLTMLVLLAHRLAIRVAIRPSGPGMLCLQFNERKRDGRLYERHSTIDEVIEYFNASCDVPAFEEVVRHV